MLMLMLWLVVALLQSAVFGVGVGVVLWLLVVVGCCDCCWEIAVSCWLQVA